MKMLDVGGMEVVTDNIRKADKENPKGYYEFEKVKKIKEDSSWLDSTLGKYSKWFLCFCMIFQKKGIIR